MNSKRFAVFPKMKTELKINNIAAIGEKNYQSVLHAFNIEFLYIFLNLLFHFTYFFPFPFLGIGKNMLRHFRIVSNMF